MSPRKAAANAALYLFLSFFAVVYLFPMYFTVVSSLKADFDIFFRPFALPSKLMFSNFVRAWAMSHVDVYFKNSVLLTVATCGLSLVVASMASYILARFRVRWGNTLFLFFLAGMMVPFQSTIIPLAYVIARLGIHDSVLVVILMMTAFGLPTNILIVRGFMRSIPRELEESAIIDGCAVLSVFVKIILPMSVPALVTITIMNFLGTWNNYMMPLVFINTNSLQPLATGLLSFFGERSSDYGGVMAAIIISFLPPFLLFVFAQEKIEKGMAAGALKG
jgi:raffinose/stachyose/melibiose transport system permease protein